MALVNVCSGMVAKVAPPPNSVSKLLNAAVVGAKTVKGEEALPDNNPGKFSSNWSALVIVVSNDEKFGSAPTKVTIVGSAITLLTTCTIPLVASAPPPIILAPPLRTIPAAVLLI